MKECGYQDQENMILDAIVFGTQDHKVHEKCIGKGSDLTLEKTTNFARTVKFLCSKYSLWETNRYMESRKVGYQSRKSAPTESESKLILIVKDCKYCGQTISCIW